MSKKAAKTVAAVADNGLAGQFSVVTFPVHVDYDQAQSWPGTVHEMDEEHDGQLVPRIQRQLPTGVNLINMAFVRPWNNGMALGDVLNSVMKFGPRPANHHEIQTFVKSATSEQVQRLFDQIDMAMRAMHYGNLSSSVVITCLSEAVVGKKTGDLQLLMHEVPRVPHWMKRLHLRKFDLEARIPAAQVIAFVTSTT